MHSPRCAALALGLILFASAAVGQIVEGNPGEAGRAGGGAPGPVITQTPTVNTGGVSPWTTTQGPTIAGTGVAPGGAPTGGSPGSGPAESEDAVALRELHRQFGQGPWTFQVLQKARGAD
jgi:hypothetical protein